MTAVDDDLREALEIACMDAMRGDPPGPMMARRLEGAVRGVLRMRGLGAAKVSATSDRQGTSVSIELPPTLPTVRQIVLNLGGR